MEKIFEKCGCEEGGCRCEIDETEESTTDNGDDDPNEIRACPFNKVTPTIILGIKHSNFTKEQIDNLFGVRG